MKNEYKIIKEEHFFRSEQKLKFCGYGEWVEEPDFVNLEYRGYEAAIHRVFKREPYAKEEAWFGGHFCGYVKIPEDHPYFGIKYGDMDICAHGGLTFGECHEEHWVGYDCGHSGDYVPTMEHFKKLRKAAGELEMFPIPKEFEKFALFNPVYRNVQYCIDTCVEMIDDLIKIAEEKSAAKKEGCSEQKS